MTKKVFYENPYVSEWNAEIIKSEVVEGRNILVLSETIFYPEGGGQPCDLGTIDGIKVIYVYEEGDTVYHVVEAIPENNQVHCSIDFQRRFDHMQQHTGEHILSGLFMKTFNGANKGFHLGEEYVTIDIDLPEVTEDMLKNIQEEANSTIYKNVDISTCICTKEEAARMPLRKELKVESDIRVVSTGDVDCVACCGTHVTKTGEVGLIKIIKSERYKGMTRIYFKCGRRAMEDYNQKFDIITRLTRHLSSEEDVLPAKVEGQSNTIKDLNKTIIELNMKLAEFEAIELSKSAEDGVIAKSFNLKSFNEIQYIAKHLEKEPYILILSSEQDKTLVFAHNGSFDLQCGKLFKEKISSYNGRGGGGPKRAQGSFNSEEDMNSFMEYLMEESLKAKETLQ